MNKGKYLNDTISSIEIEEIVKKLSPLKIEEYCSIETIKAYSIYEKLNMQSYKNSVLGTEDFIMNTFVNEEKIKEVIVNLFVIELFKLKIFPLIKEELSSSKFCVKAYFCLHFESTLINLLEKFFYFITACQAADNLLLDVVEYCYYYISTNLVSDRLVKQLKVIETVKLDEKDVDHLEELTSKQKDIEYSNSIACVSIIRFISDHLDQLSFPITNHLLNSKDFPLLLVEVIEAKPWEKKDENTKEITHIYEENKWVSLKSKEKEKLQGSFSKYEAQVWLCLYNLLIVQGGKYEITDFRKNIIMKLKKHMNQRLYDQIPPIVNLYRALEELSISNPSSVNSMLTKSILVEMIPELFLFNHSNKCDKALDFKMLAGKILEGFFKKADLKEEMRIITEVYTPENLDYFMENPKCGNCGNEATNRCKQCKSEWYCSKECQIMRWKNGHKEFCLKMKAMNEELEKNKDNQPNS